MLREAARRGIAVSPEDVDAALSEFLLAGGNDNLLEELSTAVIDGEKFLRQIIHDEKVNQVLTEQLLEEIIIPPGDVVTLHHDIKHTLMTPEEVCVRHIQLATVEAAEQIILDLGNDADFAELASNRSGDEATAGNGGDFGCFQKGHSEAGSEFEGAAFEAKKGSIVGPVKSGLGYHVIQVYEHRAAHETTLNEAYDEIERELKHEQLPNRISALVRESGVKTYPENFAAANAGE
jgi:parvulin-like peptidyl-prolyl isomerase